MASRIELQAKLEELLGSRNVYYQPLASIQMKYPAIVYSRKSIGSAFANNSIYRQDDSYELTVIDKNPDSEIPKKILSLPFCGFDRHFVSDNLNHDVFTIFY